MTENVNETLTDMAKKAIDEIYVVMTRMLTDARSPVEIYNSCDSIIRLKYFQAFRTKTQTLPEEVTHSEALEMVRTKLHMDGKNRWISGRRGVTCEHNLALLENGDGFNLILLELGSSMDYSKEVPAEKQVVKVFETSVNNDLLMS